jgi:uncharacterized protein (TIGR03067 family)
MRTLAPALAAAALALVAHGAPAPLPKPDPGKADLMAMQGVWELTEKASGGRPLVRSRRRVAVKGNRLAVLQDGRLSEADDIAVDARAKPKALDLKDAKRPRHILAVYSLRGDTLTICSTGEHRKARPRDVTGAAPQDIEGLLASFRPALAPPALLEEFVEVPGQDAHPLQNDPPPEVHHDRQEVAGLIPLTDAVLAVAVDKDVVEGLGFPGEQGRAFGPFVPGMRLHKRREVLELGDEPPEVIRPDSKGPSGSGAASRP